MNPFTNRRSLLYTYITVILIVAVIYSLVLNNVDQLSVSLIAAHSLAISALSILFFLLLWNFYYYTVSKLSLKIVEVFLLILIGFIYAGLMLYSEHFLYYYAFPEQYLTYLSTIYIRALIYLLIYSIIALYYIFYVAIKKIDDTSTEILEEEILETIQNTPVSTIIEHVNVTTGKGIEVIRVGDIISLKANGDYVIVSTKDERWLKEQTMKYFETSLPPKEFVRIHRSHIVNISSISRIERIGDKKVVLLTNGDKIPVSATGDKALRIKLNL